MKIPSEKKYHFFGLIGLLILMSNLGCQRAIPGIAEEFTYNDLYTLDNGKDLVSISPSINMDGTVNAVVEIPAGTLAKWEVNGRLQDGTKPDDGKLRWEFENGKPRVIRYIGYPGNYGFIPRTLNGDGDQLDILLLGPPLPMGAVVTAKVIGVLKMKDEQEMDDKILAVTKDSPFFEVDDMKEMDTLFPGVREIIEIWFIHYKGQAPVSIHGWGNKEEAEGIIKQSMDGFVS
jgi:inorganic pyrophosphatase